MLAQAGSETPFDRGPEMPRELAGVKLTVRAVEREAEAIGPNIAACD